LHEEEQNIDIREKLLNLPKVKAGDDFANALQRKINIADAELNQKKITEEVKESVWVKLFGKKRNPWLIPSLSLTIIAIFVIAVFLFPTKKEIDITGVQNSDKKTTTLENAPTQEKQEELKKDELPGKEITSDLTTDSRKSDLRSSYETSKGYTEQPLMEKVLSPVERESGVSPAPMKLDDVKKEETGKSEFKKEERINQQFDNSVREEKVSPKEGNLKADETKQKVKTEEKTESKDNIESKGLIEKKEKVTMKKTAKSTTDSTKIDKKVLEKIKEEIEKNAEEKK
jgi:hypothetical protein